MGAMKKIVVLGNSITAIKVIEEIKFSGEDVEAVVISSENTFPYYRNLLNTLPGKKNQQNKILYRSNEEYQKEKIGFIFDKAVTRINFKRNRLTLEDKEQIDYDVLLLSDLVRDPFYGVKGANKEGLYNLKRLSDMTALSKSLALIETLVVQSDSFAGLEMARAFCEIKKEVILLTSEKNILGNFLASDDALALEVILQEQGLRIMKDSQIVEILGDTQAKAIRLQTGKVFGCQAILTDCDLPDLRLFKETQLQCSQRVSVNTAHQTNFDNVFALDAVCDTMKTSDWDVSQNYLQSVDQQSQIIAAKIIGKEFPIIPEHLFTWDFELKGEVAKLSILAAKEELPGSPNIEISNEEAVVIS
jgi:NAD(P)H-nitrite reductase large subunit